MSSKFYFRQCCWCTSRIILTWKVSVWGNPLYDWDEHEKEGYSWWIDRLKSQTEIFDIVRIDHFRAFNDYWSIPSSGNAKLGNWELGPGMKFWDKINKVFPDRPFLAEDLGLITDEVRSLREKAGFAGDGGPSICL